MKRLLKNVIICTIAALIPFGAFVTVGECVDNNYENVFTAALADKYERLININEQKIVFVGGSSLPFALKCDLIERELGIKAVDLGVYASLGTKAMMEISLANLNPGDVVILAPELSAQTYSLYFNADVMWQAINFKREIIKTLSFDEKVDMAYNYFDFLYNKIRLSGEEGVSADELYSRTSFNEYGDLSYPRKGNIMAGGYDKSQLVSLDIGDGDFFDYVNEYAAELRRRNVDLYFTFSPTNAPAATFDEGSALAFKENLSNKLDCEVIGTVSGFTYDMQYFYNTNYHLNDRGAVLHTKNLIDLIKGAFGIDTPTDIEVPEPSEDEDVFFGEDENEKYFVVENIGGAYYITGVKEEFKSMTELTLPVYSGGRTVKGLSARCLEGCSRLKKITIPDNYRMFDVDIFYGCSELTEIYLETENPGTTSIPDTGLFDGAAENVKVYVKSSQYLAFKRNYTWAKYEEYLNKY